MLFSKKLTVTFGLIALMVLGIAAAKPPADPTFKNLKVLPKNTSHDDLDKIMHGFNRSLGVKCNFCHAQSKDDPKKLDFSSDEKEEKGAARSMMRMAMKINKKFFKVKRPAIGDTVSVVTCNTCHHGNPHPEENQADQKK